MATEQMADVGTFSVLIPIPGEHGVVVVPLGDLVASVVLGHIDLDDLAFESSLSDTEAIELIGRVRRLNATGDVDGFHAGFTS